MEGGPEPQRRRRCHTRDPGCGCWPLTPQAAPTQPGQPCFIPLCRDGSCATGTHKPLGCRTLSCAQGPEGPEPRWARPSPQAGCHVTCTQAKTQPLPGEPHAPVTCDMLATAPIRLLPAGSSVPPLPSGCHLPGLGCRQFAVGFVCEPWPRGRPQQASISAPAAPSPLPPPGPCGASLKGPGTDGAGQPSAATLLFSVFSVHTQTLARAPGPPR